jgi:hypothetical protein
MRNRTDLGAAYANDTGIAGKLLLAGAENFVVAEIEVFVLVPKT